MLPNMVMIGNMAIILVLMFKERVKFERNQIPNKLREIIIRIHCSVIIKFFFLQR